MSCNEVIVPQIFLHFVIFVVGTGTGTGTDNEKAHPKTGNLLEYRQGIAAFDLIANTQQKSIHTEYCAEWAVKLDKRNGNDVKNAKKMCANVQCASNSLLSKWTDNF